MYIVADDMTVMGTGATGWTELRVGAAGKMLMTMLEDDLRARVSIQKTWATTSTEKGFQGLQLAGGLRFRIARAPRGKGSVLT